MNFQDIYDFFEEPPPQYLSKELATAYVLAILLEGESSSVMMMRQLEQHYPSYRLSEHVLRTVLEFLLAKGVIQSRWEQPQGRGRPCRLYCLAPDDRVLAQDLAQRWHQYSAV
ncbi:MAG: PadR family transcriptional regulator [Prochlorothrix sp.]|nr:PadR family transcriptional regulator [Prochlorothrix sp.]